jgi:hypothetical protein
MIFAMGFHVIAVLSARKLPLPTIRNLCSEIVDAGIVSVKERLSSILSK